jgi:large subunit ribosomal protein L6
MSRVAKNPIAIPTGVDVTIAGQVLTLKGPKGELTQVIHPYVVVEKEDNELKIVLTDATSGKGEGSKNKIKIQVHAMAGTMRAIVNNMMLGVSQGFKRALKMVGVGYRAQIQGRVLNIQAGFSHPVTFTAPEGVTITVPTQTEIVISGADKQAVGQVAADIRSIRPPEPYKGKGIRYADERVIIKETKKK